MKRIFVMASVLLLTGLSFCQAQENSTSNSTEYSTAVGIKFYPTGITLKHFIADTKALEFVGYFYNEGTRVTGLYEIYDNLLKVQGLQWYVGPGAHVALYNNKHGGYTSIGIDGVIGLDYKINNAPINLSVDYQPSIQLTSFFGDRFTSWGGIGIRYTF